MLKLARSIFYTIIATGLTNCAHQHGSAKSEMMRSQNRSGKSGMRRSQSKSEFSFHSPPPLKDAPNYVRYAWLQEAYRHIHSQHKAFEPIAMAEGVSCSMYYNINKAMHAAREAEGHPSKPKHSE